MDSYNSYEEIAIENNLLKEYYYIIIIRKKKSKNIITDNYV